MGDTIEKYPHLHPGCGPIKLRTSTDHLNEYVELRDDRLHTGFNFQEQKWKSPLKIEEIKQKANNIIIDAQAALKTLIMRKKREI